VAVFDRVSSEVLDDLPEPVPVGHDDPVGLDPEGGVGRLDARPAALDEVREPHGARIGDRLALAGQRHTVVRNDLPAINPDGVGDHR